MTQRTCSIDGCEKPHRARGWCAKHYDRWKTYGDPTDPVPRDLLAMRIASSAARFWTKVEVPSDPLACWIWAGAKDPKGYGRYHHLGKAVLAHRLGYELCLGPIPNGLQLDHLCRNPSCVNPVHLDPVTGAENTRRGRAANGATCRKGHRYPDVVKLNPSGSKRCPECETERNRAAKLRKANQRG